MQLRFNGSVPLRQVERDSASDLVAGVDIGEEERLAGRSRIGGELLARRIEHELGAGVEGLRLAADVLHRDVQDREPYVSRHEQVATLVAQLRGAYARHLGEPAWTGFVRRLQAVSATFARLWDEHEVASQATYLKVYRHPAYPKLTLTTTSLAVQAVPGTRMVVYRPADEVTRDAIARLLAGEGKDAQYPCWEAHQQRKAGLAG